MSEALENFRDARVKLLARLSAIKGEIASLTKEAADIETDLGPPPKHTRGKDRGPRKRKGQQEITCQES